MSAKHVANIYNEIERLTARNNGKPLEVERVSTLDSANPEKELLNGLRQIRVFRYESKNWEIRRVY